MKLNCPSCGALMSLDVIVSHDGARDAVQIALQLPAPLGKLIIQYLTLFRPARRQLSLDRVASILGELLPMITDSRISRDGKTYPIAQPIWAAGLQEIMDKHRQKPLTLPLKSHGYLLEILINKAHSAEAKLEAKLEQQRQMPSTRQIEKRSNTDKPVPIGEHLSAMKKAINGHAEEKTISFAELTQMARQKELERNPTEEKL
jgi:hypothetical protein